MHKTKITVIIMLFISTSIHSEDKIKYPYVKDGWLHVDSELSIQQVKNGGNIVKSWFKENSGDSYSMIEFKINCSENQIATLQSIKYAKTGKVINSWRAPYEEMSDIAPDSLGWGLRTIMCENSE